MRAMISIKLSHLTVLGRRDTYVSRDMMYCTSSMLEHECVADPSAPIPPCTSLPEGTLWNRYGANLGRLWNSCP